MCGHVSVRVGMRVGVRVRFSVGEEVQELILGI